MNPSKPTGKIITFYSYKGGTGRSMAVANIAWILATAGHSVLVIDWDLEAPGLHRYFRPFLIDKELSASEGIIDYIIEFCDEAIRPLGEGERLADDWYVKFADLSRYRLSIDFEDFPRGGKIDFVPAGQQGSTYATRVNSFNWQDFYQRLGGGPFIEATREWVRKQYDYILIDSRTGVSDTAGICTVQLPDTLAIFFTFNNQSITGAAAVAQSVFDQRKDRFEGRHRFRVLPVPTRVDQTERDKLDNRKLYARASFATFLEAIPEPDRPGYWDQVEVPYVPWFAYEEVLSPFRDSAGDPKTVLASMKRITDFLVQPEIERFEFAPLMSPEQKQRILSEFAATPTTEDQAESTVPSESPLEKALRLAERNFLALTDEERDAARRLWLRLVRVPRPHERSENTKVRVLTEDLSYIPVQVVERFTLAGLLVKAFDDKANEPTVEVVNEELLRNWKRLQEWIDQDRDFLLWRQLLTNRIADWKTSASADHLLLSPDELTEALRWAATKKDDLNSRELAYIQSSSDRQRRQKTQKRVGMAIAAAVIVVMVVLIVGVRQYASYRERVKLAEKLVTQAEQIIQTSSGMPGRSRADQLQLAILLEIEADRLSPSSDTRKLITTHLALLPRRISNLPQEREIQRVAISKNGDRVVAILGRTTDVEEKTAMVLDTSSQKQLTALRFTASLRGARISPDGKVLISYPFADSSPKPNPQQPVQVWDLETGYSTSLPVNGQIYNAVISPENRFLVFDTSTNMQAFDLQLTFSKRLPITEQRLSGSNKVLAFNSVGDYAAIRSGRVVIVRALNERPSGDGAPSATVLPITEVYASALSRSGKLLAVQNAAAAEIDIWDTTTAKKTARLTDLKAGARFFFTADEQMLVTWLDGLSVWDLGSLQRKAQLDVDFDRWILRPGGGLFATVDNNIARIWRYSEGNFEETGIVFLDGSINDLAFSRENDLVVAGGTDKSLLTWDLHPPTSTTPDQKDYCARLTRNLSGTEWTTYLGSNTYHQTCSSSAAQNGAK
jgi:cellulose biosynthesis protein BcsQ/WD40 repeat protein